MPYLKLMADKGDVIEFSVEGIDITVEVLFIGKQRIQVGIVAPLAVHIHKESASDQVGNIIDPQLDEQVDPSDLLK